MAFSTLSRSLIRKLSKSSLSSRSISHGLSNSSNIDAGAYHLGNGSSYMRGTVFWEPNKPLTIEEFHMPRPKTGEILIKTKACGVCHSDLHVLKGELPFASPCVVGHEITGEVVEHGAHTDRGILKRFPVGSHVVGAFIMPCGNCFYCVKGQEDLCEAFFAYNRAKGTLYDGETRLFLRSNGKPVYMYSMGGLAEYCVVPAHALAILPNSLPYTESAILGCAVFTAYGALRHAANMRGGDAIAVIGVGGVGTSCLQIARAFGAAEIIAVDVQDEKLHHAKILGATHTVNAKNEDVVEKIKEITGGRGVDIAVEALGKPLTFSQCTQSVRDGGKAVMIGVTASTAVGEVDINRLVRRQVFVKVEKVKEEEEEKQRRERVMCCHKPQKRSRRTPCCLVCDDFSHPCGPYSPRYCDDSADPTSVRPAVPFVTISGRFPAVVLAISTAPTLSSPVTSNQ